MTAVLGRPAGHNTRDTDGDRAWMDRAACAGLDVDLFYAGDSDRTRARLVCRDCPVRDACLAYAMTQEASANFYRWGMWGGLTARQRRALARQRIGAGQVAS